MVRERVEHRPEYLEVVYDEKHWKLLDKLRGEAACILKALAKYGLQAWVHGSVARGDVWEGSDVDIVILEPPPPYLVEYALEISGYTIYDRQIVVATPSNTPKAYISLDAEEKRVVSFPLFKLKPREYEFYKFGGMIGYTGLKQGIRVPGVDKRLVFIEPTPKGHRESPVIGYESVVAAKLGISIDTVLERVRVLSRRGELGRTGVFISYELAPDETFEEALDNVLRRNPLLREFLNKG